MRGGEGCLGDGSGHSHSKRAPRVRSQPHTAYWAAARRRRLEIACGGVVRIGGGSRTAAATRDQAAGGTGHEGKEHTASAGDSPPPPTTTTTRGPSPQSGRPPAAPRTPPRALAGRRWPQDVVGIEWLKRGPRGGRLQAGGAGGLNKWALFGLEPAQSDDAGWCWVGHGADATRAIS